MMTAASIVERVRMRRGEIIIVPRVVYSCIRPLILRPMSHLGSNFHLTAIASRTRFPPDRIMQCPVHYSDAQPIVLIHGLKNTAN